MRLNRRTFLAGMGFAFFSLFSLNKRGEGSRRRKGHVGYGGSRQDVPDAFVKQGAKVISAHASEATHRHEASCPYVDSINQEVVQRMLNESLKELVSEDVSKHAWESIFRSYRHGDKIAIKPNFNDLYKGFRANLVASPAVLNAILDGLIRQLDVPASDITIYDCTRIIPNVYRERIEFSVNYVEPFGSSFWRKVRYHTMGNPLPLADHEQAILMNRDVKDKQGNPIRCYLPHVITQARHIINVPILKAHQFVSHSGSLKNHYGTVRFSDGHTGPEYLHPPLIHESIVDINSHEQIRQKTRLIVMDALFGRLKKKGGPPDTWMLYQGEGNPNRLLVSRDPVALDSVAYEFLREEAELRQETLLSHEFLHLAERHGLGIHDHSDDAGGFGRIPFRQIEVS